MEDIGKRATEENRDDKGGDRRQEKTKSKRNLEFVQRELLLDGILTPANVSRRTSIKGIGDYVVGEAVEARREGALAWFQGRVAGRYVQLDGTVLYSVALDGNARWIEGVVDARIRRRDVQRSGNNAATVLSQPPTPGALISAARKRQLVMEEIVETERAYVASLVTLINSYVMPLKYPVQWGGLRKSSVLDTTVLTDEESRSVFGNIEEITGLNKMFLSQLEAKDLDNASTTLGDVFLNFGHYFKVYTIYSNGFSDASETVQTLVANRLPFLQHMQHAIEEGKEALESLMIKPVQRVPRYKLLLKELLKRTPEEHMDYALVQRALAVISDVAMHINEHLRRYENQAKTMEIANSFHPPCSNLVAPARVFLLSAEMRKVNKRGKSEAYTFWLFNDVVLYGCKHIMPGKTHLNRLQRKLTVKGASANALSRAAVKLKPEKAERTFLIYGAEKTIAIRAADAVQKAEWVNAIQIATGSSHDITTAGSHKSVPLSKLRAFGMAGATMEQKLKALRRATMSSKCE